MTALLLAGLAGTAWATVVEGTVSFPGGFLPAMTVYARAVEGGHLRSVGTHPAQGSFRLDLPPGHYAFFAEPSQAGAPQIYGAWTQAVTCHQRNAQDACEDHALITLSVGSAAIEGGAGPVIADWSIPDALAEEFDHALGNRTDPGPQELGAPRFSEYPVSTAPTTIRPALDFSATDIGAEQQRHIREALPAAPNFAGGVALVQLPCGAGCVDLLLVEWKSGKVQAPASLERITQELPCRGEESILYRPDSRLLAVTRRRKDGIVTQYFLWKPSGTLTQTAEYQRSAERYCSLPSP
ncbi:MAG: hypothetical protein JSS24_00425 [Proteobacteria bacterium]|nr:hypothetical protein [Pseudomonadota bacterium]